MQIILNSIEELKDICSLIGGTKFIPEQGQAIPVKTEKPKEVVKAADKKDKVTPVETKKEEPTKVNAEVTGVDTTSTDIKDAEVNEENSGEEVNITKEMVREICSKAMKAGKSVEVKNIISKYGAANIPGLKEECYADAYKDVEALL